MASNQLQSRNQHKRHHQHYILPSWLYQKLEIRIQRQQGAARKGPFAGSADRCRAAGGRPPARADRWRAGQRGPMYSAGHIPTSQPGQTRAASTKNRAGHSGPSDTNIETVSARGRIASQITSTSSRHRLWLVSPFSRQPKAAKSRSSSPTLSLSPLGGVLCLSSTCISQSVCPYKYQTSIGIRHNANNHWPVSDRIRRDVRSGCGFRQSAARYP